MNEKSKKLLELKKKKSQNPIGEEELKEKVVRDNNIKKNKESMREKAKGDGRNLELIS